LPVNCVSAFTTDGAITGTGGSPQHRVEKAEGNVHALYETRSDPNDASKPAVLVTISLKHGNQATIVNNGN